MSSLACLLVYRFQETPWPDQTIRTSGATCHPPTKLGVATLASQTVHNPAVLLLPASAVRYGVVDGTRVQ